MDHIDALIEELRRNDRCNTDCEYSSGYLHSKLATGQRIYESICGGSHSWYELDGEVLDPACLQYQQSCGGPVSEDDLRSQQLLEAVQRGRFTKDQHQKFMTLVRRRLGCP